jgi:hypothetical protein
MTVLDMADARSRRVGVAAPEVGISIDDPPAGDARRLVKRDLDLAGMDS